jgi:hypothetical protein
MKVILDRYEQKLDRSDNVQYKPGIPYLINVHGIVSEIKNAKGRTFPLYADFMRFMQATRTKVT